MQKPMTDEELAEIRARCDAATEGPWFIDYDKRADGCHQIVRINDDGRLLTICFMATPADATEDDAKLMAASRTDTPRLLDEIARLKLAMELK